MLLYLEICFSKKIKLPLSFKSSNENIVSSLIWLKTSLLSCTWIDWGPWIWTSHTLSRDIPTTTDNFWISSSLLCVDKKTALKTLLCSLHTYIFNFGITALKNNRLFVLFYLNCGWFTWNGPNCTDEFRLLVHRFGWDLPETYATCPLRRNSTACRCIFQSGSSPATPASVSGCFAMRVR